MNIQLIRNFCIIAHIDHGKSTLADRFLELTNSINQKKMRPQYLDQMDLERGRGITIKLHPARMIYRPSQIRNNLEITNSEYILNLIDTPGHVDFSYEVSRSLAAVEGAILLVDATKGIQAQTLANLELAKNQGLVIIPVVNKIDLPQARTEETVAELAELLEIDKDKIIKISAKFGTNIKQLLEDIIKKIPCPTGNRKLSCNLEAPLRALIFDSKYDFYKGVIAYVRIVDGKISTDDKIYLTQTETAGRAREVGYLIPEFSSQKELKAGDIGYIATSIKEPGKVRVGDTITIQNSELKSLSGYKEPQSVVFASLYPVNPDNFDLLKESLSKLRLTDPSLVYELEKKEALGRGFRCGFLGSLHGEIVFERLRQEFGLDLIISTPSVVYKIIDQKNHEISIYSPQNWPTPDKIKEIKEPWVKLEIITPQNFLGRVSELLKSLEGNYIKTKYFASGKLLLIYEVPLRGIIAGFYDKLKSQSQGFASMDYQILGYRSGDLIKLEILVAGQKQEAFSKIVSSKEAFREGKRIVEKLKEILPPQLFAVSLQAVIAGKIIARETISAKRRDVIAPLYGGDYTRKKKLLEQQKKGKKKLKEKGEIKIPSKVFLEMLK